MPLASIVIPTYNRVDLIAETLMSALEQDYQNIEVIVTDNASTDGMQQLWNLLTRLSRKVVSPRNKPRAVLNRKAGLGYSTGEYIKILCLMI